MDPKQVNYNYCEDLSTNPLPPKTKVLVTGANGYVAHRLIPELVERGYEVRCMVQNKNIPFVLEHPRLELVYADSLKKDELEPVLRDIEVAYYLIHSMKAKKSKFAEIDKALAQNFVDVAEKCGVKKIIYLGGLGETDSRLSSHLKSRMEVGEILSNSSITVICLRAAIIIGTGSISYELLKSMVSHNRWIPFLRDFNNLCQCIAIRDVIKYLVGVLETPELKTRVYHIGGKDVLAYKDMILRMARIMDKQVKLFEVHWFPLPVSLLCRIYAYWLHFFVSVPVNIISLLLNSLKCDVVCHDQDIRRIIPFEPLGFDSSVKFALDREKHSQVFSHWADVPPDKMKNLMPLCEYESSNFMVEEHSIEISANAHQVFNLITKIGGEQGWLQGNILWRIRGLIDRIFGGVGLQRGRRDPDKLRVGDSLDFWRVEKLEPDKELLLRAELISPGLSWLQFQLEPTSNQSTKLTLKAHFIPKPFWGQIYWSVLSKFHTYIFTGMLVHFKRKATKAQ
ncbi:MAG: SDR family oxidoreductase [Nitrospinales bacterium]